MNGLYFNYILLKVAGCIDGSSSGRFPEEFFVGRDPRDTDISECLRDNREESSKIYPKVLS